MKKVVVYQSGTGFTAKYAEWIAQQLRCETKELKSVNLHELVSYDLVVYGGWIMAGMVSGYDKLKGLELKKLIVYGVGMTVPSEQIVNQLAQQNQIPRECFFYFEGGYNPQKLGFMKRMMLNMMRKSIEKKENKSAEELHMLETFQGKDRTSKEAIKGLLEACK